MSSPTLRQVSWVFIGAWIVHNGDHVRRGFDSITDAVAWGGTGVAMLAAVVMTLVFTGHRRAPAAAAVAGAAIAFGVAAAHLPPDWGPLSDSLVDGGVDWFTWVAVIGEIAAAIWLAWAGLRIIRRHAYALDVPTEAWNVGSGLTSR